MPNFRYYTIPGKTTQYRTDGSKTWYKNPHDTWTLLRTGHGPTYGRFGGVPQGRGAPREASAALRNGSAFTYRVHVRQKVALGRVIAQEAVRNGKRRRVGLGKLMGESASDHAIRYGASNLLRYEWCHLIGHGLGGMDNGSNLVAASRDANSEQLQMERIAYGYRNRQIFLRVTWERYENKNSPVAEDAADAANDRAVAAVAPGSPPPLPAVITALRDKAAKAAAKTSQVAEKIIFELVFKGRVIYSRKINGFRVGRPSAIEVAKVSSDVTNAIIKAFKNQV